MVRSDVFLGAHCAGGRQTVQTLLLDRLGEQIADELVGWFNAVDLTYRSDLREINELNFSQFDSKMEQRFAEFDAKWEKKLAELDAKWERRLAEQNALIERRFAEPTRGLFLSWAAQLALLVGSLARA